jgi:hypothetical protein
MRRSVRAVLVCGAAVVCAAGAAAAQEVRGRVVHGETGRPVAGVEVRVLGMEAGTPPTEVVVRTDADGIFRVGGPVRRRTVVVQATYRGVVYTSGPHRPQGDLVLTLRVFETTADPRGLYVARRAILLEPEAGGLGVREVVVLGNALRRTFTGQGGTTVRVPLLVGAQDVRVARGMAPAGTDPSGALVDTLPVWPGERPVVLAYRVAARGPTLLELPVGLPTLALDVFAAEPLQVSSEALRPREQRQVEGRRVVRLAADRLPPDLVVRMRVFGLPRPSAAPAWVLGGLLAAACAGFVARPLLRAG